MGYLLILHPAAGQAAFTGKIALIGIVAFQAGKNNKPRVCGA